MKLRRNLSGIFIFDKLEEDFNDSLNKLFGTIAFPELNKGECVEMELICELKVKTEKCE